MGSGILGALSDGQRRGLVVLNRRLYQVPAAYIAAADKRHLDFGHCLLRLPDENGQPTR